MRKTHILKQSVELKVQQIIMKLTYYNECNKSRLGQNSIKYIKVWGSVVSITDVTLNKGRIEKDNCCNKFGKIKSSNIAEFKIRAYV